MPHHYIITAARHCTHGVGQPGADVLQGLLVHVQLAAQLRLRRVCVYVCVQLLNLACASLVARHQSIPY